MTDLFKTLTGAKAIQALVFGWLIPVAIGGGVFVVVLYPSVADTRGIHAVRDGATRLGMNSATFFILIAVLMAASLSLLSRTLYQIIEGLAGWPQFARRWRIDRHQVQWDVLNAGRVLSDAEAELAQRRLDRDRALARRTSAVGPAPRLDQELHACQHAADVANNSVIAARAELATAESTCSRRSFPGRDRPLFVLTSFGEYPFRRDLVQATRFGNLMKSLESFGYATYRLDSQTFWYELTALVPSTAAESVTDARIGADFFVASMYVTTALTAAASGVWFATRSPSAAVLAGAGLVLLPLLHERLRRATIEWRYAVQAIVHLGRLPLARALGLDLPMALQDERRMWDAIMGSVQYRSDAWLRRVERFRAQRPESP